MSLWSQLQTHLTPAARQAAWNFAWMVLARLVSQAALFGVVLVLARSLTTQEFGMFMTALALQGYVYLIGSAGMPAVVVRELVRRPDQQGRIASTYLAFTSALGLATWGASSAVVWFAPITSNEQLLFVFMTLGAAIASVNPEPLFDARHRQAVAAAIFSAADLVLLLSVYVLALGHLSLPLLGFLFAAKWAVAVLCSTLLVPGRDALSLRAISREEAWHLWEHSKYLLLSTLLAMVPVSGPTVLARVYGGPAQAGLVGLGVQMLQVFLTIIWLGGRVMRPHLAGMHGAQPTFAIKALAFFALLSSLVCMAACTCCYLLVTVILPRHFVHALVPCFIFILAGSLGGIGIGFTEYLVAAKREADILLSHLAGSLVFIIFSSLAAWSSSVIVLPLATLSGLAAFALTSGLRLFGGTLKFRDRELACPFED